jgi:hypothetical protein
MPCVRKEIPEKRRERLECLFGGVLLTFGTLIPVDRPNENAF